MADQIYRCESCGGIMEFDARTQSLKCPNCDTTIQINTGKEVREHSFTAQAARTYSAQEKQSSTMKCSGCGATIEVDKDSTATSCPYCGSSYVLSDRQEAAIIPDGVIPFKIDQNNVREIFGNWIKKRSFAPNNLKNLYQSGIIQGRYIPFWTFDADCHGSYTGRGGNDRTEHYKDKDGNDCTRTVTDWYYTRGKLDYYFDDVMIRGTENFKTSLINGINDYDTKEVKPYSPQYFSGFMSESYTVALDSAHNSAVNIMDSELRDMARRDILRKYDRAEDIRINVNYNKETYKHIYAPMYATSYAYNNKTYTVLVNGQNGKITGEYPKSKAKIGILIAVILAIIIGLFVMSQVNAGAAQMPYDYEAYGVEAYTEDIVYDNMTEDNEDFVAESDITYYNNVLEEITTDLYI